MGKAEKRRSRKANQRSWEARKQGSKEAERYRKVEQERQKSREAGKQGKAEKQRSWKPESKKEKLNGKTHNSLDQEICARNVIQGHPIQGHPIFEIYNGWYSYGPLTTCPASVNRFPATSSNSWRRSSDASELAKQFFRISSRSIFLGTTGWSFKKRTCCLGREICFWKRNYIIDRRI